MVVMEELGRGLVGSPYASALCASSLLQSAALDGEGEAVAGRWLSTIADGSTLVVPALQERRSRYRVGDIGTVGSKAGSARDGWTLTGRKSLVVAGDEADAFVVSALVDGAPALFVCEAKDVAIDAFPSNDGVRVAELVFSDTPARLLLSRGLGALQTAADVTVAAACAEGVGVMDRLVAMTAEYMKERRQFDVPIASFQALRHRLADVKMQLELGRSMSYYATLKLAEASGSSSSTGSLGGNGVPDQRLDQRKRALSQAKVQLGQSMRFVAQQCVQLHGGIGMTDEHAASHCFKRLTMLESCGGDTLHHLGIVSETMTDDAGAASGDI
jgi:alkylation response protein AidB-like acyl-CoA dehydrogenase